MLYTADEAQVSQPKCAQGQNGDQIPLSLSLEVGGPGAEVTDQPVVFVLGQEVRYGFFDFRIWKLFDNILGVSMQGEKVVKLPEGPSPGFPHVDARIVELSRQGCQMQVSDIPYGLKLTGAGKGPELAQSYLNGVYGAV